MSLARRLAAIMAVDVAGYSRLMGEDEEGTHERLKAHLRDLVYPAIDEHHGRIVKNTGDGMLVEFASAVDAVRCAIAVQRGMADRTIKTLGRERIEFRVGINIGDVIAEPEDIYGDGVNIAARLEGIAEPGGICISEDSFRQVRGKVEVDFADMGEQPLKNIALPVRVYRAVLDNLPSAQLTAAVPLPNKPSIAVLPFQNLSGDGEQEYFVDGMVEEIITALSRIRWLFVIDRNSSFTYRGQAVDAKRVGRELGVRYVLEGSVRKSGGRVRITAELINTESAAHLWADRFDGSLDDVFDLQDKVARNVAGVIEPALQVAEMARSAHRPTCDLTAYDLYLRGFALALSTRLLPEAVSLLEQAIDRDPRYGPALAYVAVCYFRLLLDGRREDPMADRRKGIGFARRALEVAGEEPGILVNAALALAYFGEDIGAMMALVDRALALNPSFARGWYVSGVLRNWAGQPDTAIEHIEAALRLSPRARVGGAANTIGQAHFLSRRFDEAIPKLLLAIQEDPSYPPSYRALAACYAIMGRLDEAREVAARLRDISADMVPRYIPFRNSAHRELYLSGLRAAAGGTA